MRFKYLVYPEAHAKLKDSGLIDRIKTVKDTREGLPYVGGHTMEGDVVQAVNGMRMQGYFDTLTQETRKTFWQNLENVFQDRDNRKWRIERDEKIIEEKGELEDFYLLTGWLGSCVLKADEIWDFRKFGFDSLEDFVGTFGAEVWGESRGGELYKGYEWVSKNPKGRVIKNNITGDHNLDLRIYQTDMTPDVTVDPTGARVSYRPKLNADRFSVFAYHSTEPSFLVGVLKWIDQHKIPSDMLKDDGRPLIGYTKGLGHRIGEATECFGLDFFDPRMMMGGFDIPLPVLDDNYETSGRGVDGLGTTGETWACIYVGQNKELVFSYQSGSQCNPRKKPAAIFHPEDADHLLKGICYQSANGLGRTVPKSIISMIEYRFSGQMQKDIAEIRESLKR